MTAKSTRGFAAMDPEKQRAIASKGGKAAHAKGTAHRFTPEEASEAGRKGGKAAHAKGTAHRFTTEEASRAGRKGGSSRGAAAQNRTNGQGAGGAIAETGRTEPANPAAPLPGPNQGVENLGPRGNLGQPVQGPNPAQ